MVKRMKDIKVTRIIKKEMMAIQINYLLKVNNSTPEMFFAVEF